MFNKGWIKTYKVLPELVRIVDTEPDDLALFGSVIADFKTRGVYCKITSTRTHRIEMTFADNINKV